MPMLHFAYPNINERERRFLGCGRYIALSADDAPIGGEYEPAAPKVITLTTKVYTAAALLSPESSASTRKIYERKDQPDEKYFGNSQNLAYLLALLSRSRAWRFPEIPGDVWCTGSLDLGADKQPFLEAVQASGFELKLQAFLEDAQPDRLFIAPEPNLQAVDDRLLQHPSLRVLSLKEFQRASFGDFAANKTILAVFPTELPLLCNELFAPSNGSRETPQPSISAANPYRGLFAFREEDVKFFFGRTAFIAQLLQAMQRHALVSVIGASGSGKSSLLFAGLIPQMRSQRQRLVIAARPGNDPFRAAAAAIVPMLCREKNDVERLFEINAMSEGLRNGTLRLVELIEATQHTAPEHSLLVLFDQLEELYTLCRDDALRRRFLEALMELEAAFSSSRLAGNLLLALRADFLGKAVSFAPLAAHLQRSSLILAPMDASELREVIEAPARTCGVEIEDGLTERILQSISAEPGSLPLLQFALTQLWQHCQGRTFTHAAYNAVGGVEHALAAYAEQVYHALTPDEQTRAQHIFTQLVRPGEGTEDTRRLASSSEIGEENWAVAVKLADARLVVTNQKPSTTSAATSSAPDGTVELVHEALISGWQRLQEWLETDREFRMWQERLRGTLRQWKEHHGDQSALLRGLPLAEAEVWMMKRLHQFGAEELRFITASLRAHHHLRWQRRFGRLAFFGLGGLALFIVVLLRNDVALQHRIADINQMNALLHSSRVRFLSHDELGSLLHGIRGGVMAKRLNPPPFLRWQITLNLREIVDTIRERQRLEGHVLAVECLAISPDGRYAISGSHDRVANVWHLPDGRLQYALRGHAGGVRAAAVSPDSRLLATGGSDRTITLWNLADGTLLHTLSGHLGAVRSLDFSPDGDTLLSSGEDRLIMLWDVKRGATTRILSGHAQTVTIARYSHDPNMILSASEDATIKCWDAVSGKELATLRGHVGPIWDIALHPDSAMLATAGDDRTIRLWNLQTFTETMTLRGHADAVRSVAFSPDGGLLASGSDEFDCTIRVWDVAEGRELEQWKGHYNSVGQLRFTPDGSLLLSGSDDHALKLWQRHEPRKAYALLSRHQLVKSVAFHPQRPLLASGNADGTVSLWGLIDHREFQVFEGHHGAVRSVAFSPDGRLLASGSHQASLKLWNLETMTEERMLIGHGKTIRSISFSPDGSLLASGSEDRTVKIWNAATGELLRTLYGHQGNVSAVAFSPNGKWLASAGEDTTVRLWDAKQGREIQRFSGHHVAVRAIAFSPDSRLLASGSGDNTIKLWEVSTGQELRTLKGHARTLTSLAFIQNGKVLVSSSQDQTLKIWDVEHGDELATLRGHDRSINSVASSPTLPLLASASDDQTIQLWDFDLDHLLKRSCAWLQDYLSTNSHIQETDRTMCREILAAQEEQIFYNLL